ncbi:MAG: NAD(P)H-hydrate dehydratase [Desulfobacterales bacterium]|nr:NAD(P)H-hydrate dehydratase [Desulfobacterales bacterium]
MTADVGAAGRRRAGDRWGWPRACNPVMETLVLEAMTAPLPGTGNRQSWGQPPGTRSCSSLPGKTCLAIGPGLGPAPETGELVARAGPLAARCPLVIDADGLNHLAGAPGDLLKGLRGRKPCSRRTPARWRGCWRQRRPPCSSDRIACARDLAVALQRARRAQGRAHRHRPPGRQRLHVNPTGNPGMASGGMGDVLTGAIAGLIAQGVRPDTAARAAVYLHGAAADRSGPRPSGPRGFLAGEVMNALPGEIAGLLAGA